MNIFNSSLTLSLSLTLISNLDGKLLQLTADITLSTKYSRNNVCIYVNKPKGSYVHLSSWPQWMTFFIMMSVLISGEELLWSRSSFMQVKLLYLPGILKSFQPKPFHCVWNVCFFFKSNKRMFVHLYFLLFECQFGILSSGIRTFTKLSVETFNNCFTEHSNLNFWFI